MVFLCMMRRDTVKTVQKKAPKIVNIRIFNEYSVRMSHALNDRARDVLLIG